VTTQSDLILRNGYVVSMDPDRRVFSPGALAIKQGFIQAVGPDTEVLAAHTAARVLDVQGALVHPGLVDAHLHASLHTTRDVFPESLPFAEFTRYYNRWYNSLTDEDEYVGVLLACVEMVKSGVTSFMEAGTVFEPDAAARAVDEVGMRASLCEPFLWDVGSHSMASDQHEPIRRAPFDSDRALGLVGSQLWRNKAADGRVRGHVGLFGMGSASPELMQFAAACAERAGVPFTQHQSFKAEDVALDRERFDMEPLLALADLGVVNEYAALAHMNVLSEAEREVVQTLGASVVWCPASGMNWGVGATTRGAVPHLSEGDTPIGIGSDAAKFGAGHHGVFAYLSARDKGEVRVSVETIMEMLTLGGARAMRMDREIGSLEEGKRADVVVRDVEVPEAQPLINPVQTAVLSNRARASTVIVAGEIVVEDGYCTKVDELSVFAAAARSARRLVDEIGLDTRPVWPVVG
jgi:cytosine/adenosine deaminase-related metal-dependent hydrolase